jgi:hypothetical protein
MVAPSTRQRVAAEARSRCGYCLTQEIVSGIPLTVEHLVPKAAGGTDAVENLWLSCRLCNEAKGVLVEAVDPQTGRSVPLFNPRSDAWVIHFGWDNTQTRIVGKTAQGRATVEALNLNSSFRVQTRSLWVEAGYHPPD